MKRTINKFMKKMGEIKSVKVDNWGVFFLQKLQNFFNKTDYCDLTLQFNDNSQLKVHRLVLNACTDYFNILEQTCEMIDDVLIMPNELQADLVVPIVNFMYTGTLEFELKIYGKLLKTARDMNMTVLLKLLEAHRRTMEITKPKTLKQTPKTQNISKAVNTNKTIQQKNTTRTSAESVYKSVQIKPLSMVASRGDSKSQIRTVPVKGPLRCEYEGEGSFDSTFDNISYESKPLKVEFEDQFSQVEASPFEQLRQTGYNNNKRPAPSILESPPAKKPNIQDVKEYAEQQRMRKQLAEEYGDEPDFDSILDDEFHNNDDDEDFVNLQENTRPVTSKQTIIQNISPHKQTILKKSNETTPQHKPTIVVKECSPSNVDHAKIISEVLRKYPNLIKNNKNIKLKIMPTTSGSVTQKVVIKKEPEETATTTIKTEQVSPRKVNQALMSATATTTAIKTEPSEKISAGITSHKLTPVSTQPSANQPRRIDSKTMKQLIALGAENTTGPWLCLRCGVNGRPISIPSYRGFRRHLVNTHKEKIDPRLCEHCGWRSINQKELAFHMFTQHEIPTNIHFPKCEHCGTIVFDMTALDLHIDDVHPEVKEDNQQCIYCNKFFSTELMLYTHMKDFHKERARDDGVIDFSEEDETYEEYEQNLELSADNRSGSKIHILSDIGLPKCISLTQINKDGSQLSTENIVGMYGMDNVQTQILQPTDIISSISNTTVASTSEPKFIGADGNIMELTASQREEIMSQLEQQGAGDVVMVLDEPFSDKIPSNKESDDTSNRNILHDSSVEENDQNVAMNPASEEAPEDEEHEDHVMDDETIHESDDKNDALMHIETQLKLFEASEKDSQSETEKLKLKDLEESTESLDEQLKKLTDMADKSKPSKDELDERLKILTNDWTDDEDEEIKLQLEKQENHDVKSNTEDKDKSKESFDSDNEMKNLVNVNSQDKIENEIITENENKSEHKLEENVNESEKISNDSKIESENLDESLASQDSELSENEEDVLRKQPICESEEDIPITKEDDSKQIETLGNCGKKDEDEISQEKRDEEKTMKGKNSLQENENLIMADGVENKSEQKIKEENEGINTNEQKKDKNENEEKQNENIDSLEKKQEEIKNIINEWDEENENNE